MGFEQGKVISFEKAFSVFPPKEQERYRSAIDAAIKKGLPYNMDYRIVLKDGREKLIHDEGEVERDWHGNVKWMFGTTQDVTETRTQEKKLKEIKEHLDLAVSGSGAGLWDWRISSRELLINERFAEIYGYKRLEFAPLSVEKYEAFFDPADLKIMKTAREDHLAGKSEFFINEAKIKHKDGRWRWVVVRGQVNEWGEDGSAVRMSGTCVDITPEKKAQEEMFLLSARLSLAASAARVGIWDYNVVDNILVWDKQMYALYGIKEEDFSGAYEAWLAGLLPEDKKRGDDEIQLAIRGEKKFDTEFRVLWPDGSIHDIRALAEVIRDAEGKAQSLIGTNWDITEHKRAAESVQAARDNYETFFDTINDFLFVLDIEGNILHTNKTVIDRLGFTKEELAGKSVLLVHPEDRRAEAGRIVGEMLTGVSEFCPVPLITKDGVQIAVETRVKQGFWNGRPVIFGVTKDISALKLSEEIYMKAFQCHANACGLSDLDSGNYIEVNDAFCELLGFTKEEVLGKTAGELKILSDEQRNLISKQASADGIISNAIAELITKKGETKNVSFSAVNIQVQDKNFRFTSVLDLTQQIKAEEKVRSINATLEKTIRERTAQLTESNNDLQNFTHSIYKDVRTPLGALDGWTEKLSSEYSRKLDDNAVSIIRNICKESQQMARIMDDLVRYSRISQFDMMRTNVEVSRLAEEVVKKNKFESPYSKINFIVEPGLTVEGDYLMLEIVFSNLYEHTVNSVKHLPSATIEFGRVKDLQKSISFSSRPAETPVFYLKSSGGGFSMSKASEIFETFLLTKGKDLLRETVIGLAMVKKIIERHGGMIWVESAEGAGTTIYFKLQK